MDYRNHLQAFLNMAVQAQKGGKNPKPVFKKFVKFFDYEKEVKKAKKTKEEKEEGLLSGFSSKFF